MNVLGTELSMTLLTGIFKKLKRNKETFGFVMTDCGDADDRASDTIDRNAPTSPDMSCVFRRGYLKKKGAHSVPDDRMRSCILSSRHAGDTLGQWRKRYFIVNPGFLWYSRASDVTRLQIFLMRSRLMRNRSQDAFH